jgi:hypothetical protein
MIPLHAKDDMGRAANKAARAAFKLDFRLLAAASPNLDRTERAAQLTRFFAQWPMLCAAVAELELTAPSCRDAGYAEAQKARDFIEGQKA